MIFFYKSRVENPEYTIGTFTKFTNHGSKGSLIGEFEYRVRKKVYKVEGSYNLSSIPGDKFMICYNSERPSEAIVLRDKPLFLNTEKRNITIGQIAEITKINSLGIQQILFVYNVKGVSYKRWQEFDLGVSLDVLHKGMKVEVFYWPENPQRSILNLVL